MSYTPGKLIRTNSEIVPFECNSLPPGLRELQNAVDGYIEIISLPNDGKTIHYLEPCVLVAHGEALVYKKPVNLVASELAGRYIAGDVILIPAKYVRKDKI